LPRVRDLGRRIQRRGRGRGESSLPSAAAAALTSVPSLPRGTADGRRSTAGEGLWADAILLSNIPRGAFSEPKSKNGRRRPTGVLDHSARTTPAPHHVDLVAARTPLASPARGDRPYVADPRCRAGAVPEGAAAALPSGFCTRTTDGPDRDEDGSVHAEQMNSDVGEGASVAGKLRRAFCFWSYLSGSIFFAPQSRQIMTVTG
jgi:hypothetical protein